MLNSELNLVLQFFFRVNNVTVLGRKNFFFLEHILTDCLDGILDVYNHIERFLDNIQKMNDIGFLCIARKILDPSFLKEKYFKHADWLSIHFSIRVSPHTKLAWARSELVGIEFL